MRVQSRAERVARAQRKPVSIWPRSARNRWLIRAAVTVPVLAILLTIARLDPSPWTSNDALAARGELIDWGSGDLSWVAGVFPPLSAALSSLLQGNGTAFLVVASVVIGLTMQRCMGVLRRRKFSWPTTVLVLATVVLSPQLYFLATRDLQSILGLALLLLALDSLEVFVVRRATEQGFWAGIALGVAVMVDPSMWVYALIVAAVGPLIADRSGHLGQGAHTATALVLAFPAAAALSFWIFVSWWFTSDPLAVLRGFANPWFPGGVGASAKAAGVVFVLALLMSPLFVIAVLVRIRLGQHRVLIAPAIALLGLFLSLWLGVRSPGGHSYLVMVILYVVMLSPFRPTSKRQSLIRAAAMLQLLLAWLAPLLRGDQSIVGQWIRELASVVTGG